MVGATSAATLTTYSSNNGATSNVAANSTTVLSMTVPGLVANDMIVGVTKPSSQAGVGVSGAWVSAANTVQVIMSNPTAANVALTANETYFITTVRGMNMVTLPANTAAGGQTGTPAVPTNSTVEAVYTLNGSGAAATATVNAAGQVTACNVTAGGTMYWSPPTVVFTPANGSAGYGATGTSVVANGIVTGVIMNNGGSGYTAAPSVSFIGGVTFANGMYAAAVRDIANVAGLGIGNVRVAGPNQIAVEFVNTSAANIAANANDIYLFQAFDLLQVDAPLLTVYANMTCNAAAANNANNTAMNVSNILAIDQPISFVGPASNLSPAFGSNCAANVINMSYIGGLAGGTPAAGVYYATVARPTCQPPLSLYSVYLAPTSVSNNTTAEQVFTLPSNVTLMANTTIMVNKPSYTPNIAITGCRANSTSQLAITYQNVSNAAIVPPAEIYLVAAFNSCNPQLGSNETFGGCQQIVGITYTAALDSLNEIQQTLVSTGIYNGA